MRENECANVFERDCEGEGEGGKFGFAIVKDNRKRKSQ